MSNLITVRNVNQALSDALWLLVANGENEPSRNGAVVVAPGPVLTTYTHPQERVLFSPMRNANPFFHLMEALWMLAGNNDLAWPLFFNSRFKEYSDDGKTIRGAYGHRWREWFGVDQLPLLVELLRRDPTTRRAVLNMWSTADDLYSDSRDVPCNTQAYFDLRGGALNMTVCCRSNDLLWGAYGANAVHFSMLQEYLASWLNVKMGEYRQFSNNLHLYTGVVAHEDIKRLAINAEGHNYYEALAQRVEPLALKSEDVPMELWDQDLQWFLQDPSGDTLYNHAFFNEVAAPMYAAWSDRKQRYSNGLSAANAISASDWRRACMEWIQRAELKNPI